jgi:hypothetical protein
MMRLSLPRFVGCAVVLVATLCSLPHARAQSEPPAQGTSRGENFSAKPPAQLFASDCTGSGCHKSPQGLARAQGFGSLAGFLREHYTNSRESAAALANYLTKLPKGAAEPREARTPRPPRPTGSASAPGAPGWIEGEGKPPPHEAREPRQNATARSSRATVRPEEEPAGATHYPAGEPVEAAKPESPPKPSARERRGRQPATAAVTPPTPPPEPQAAPAPPSPPSKPPPKHYDIFD